MAHDRSRAPLVTVVIPTRDRLPLLRQAVSSVASQTLSEWQLVVVDDASSDDTPLWLAGLTDPRIDGVRCDQHEERSAARNLGLEQAEGQFVLFLDDDDRLRPQALRKLVAALSRRPDAFAAVGAKALFDEAGHSRREVHPWWPVVRAAWREVVAGWVAISGQMLLRTVELREAGGFDLTTPPAEDQELWLRMGHLRPATFIPSVVVEQRARAGWRDEAGTARIERDIRRCFVDRLSGADRIEAEHLVESRDELKESVATFGAGDFRSAARHILRAAQLSPSVMASPVIGPSLALALAKAAVAGAVPRPAGLAMRRGLRELRAVQRRAPMRGRGS